MKLGQKLVQPVANFDSNNDKYFGKRSSRPSSKRQMKSPSPMRQMMSPSPMLEINSPRDLV